jgi:hypothetical protein
MRRLAGPALACVLLAGCGGGGDDSGPLDVAGTLAAAPPAAGATAAVSAVPADTLQLVDERAVDTGMVDRVYRVRFRNGGPPQTGVVATLLWAGPQAVVLRGRVAIGAMPAGVVLLPADTVTLRQPRAAVIDVASWRWVFSVSAAAAASAAASAPEALVATTPAPLNRDEALPTPDGSPEDQARFH